MQQLIARTKSWSKCALCGQVGQWARSCTAEVSKGAAMPATPVSSTSSTKPRQTTLPSFVHGLSEDNGKQNMVEFNGFHKAELAGDLEFQNHYDGELADECCPQVCDRTGACDIVHDYGQLSHNTCGAFEQVEGKERVTCCVTCMQRSWNRPLAVSTEPSTGPVTRVYISEYCHEEGVSRRRISGIEKYC
eukprot:843677-Amphidinium_carterae.1